MHDKARHRRVDTSSYRNELISNSELQQPGNGGNNHLFPALASGDIKRIKYIFISEKFHALVRSNLPLPCSTQFSLDIARGILLSHRGSIGPPDRGLLVHPRPLVRRAIPSLVMGEATAHARSLLTYYSDTNNGGCSQRIYGVSTYFFFYPPADGKK